MKHKITLFAVVLMASAMFAGPISAQWSQSTACPGWNNPVNFTTDHSWYWYSGEGGRVTGYQTGSNIINVPQWTTTYTASQLNQGVTTGSCSGTGIPFHGNAFTILDTNSQVSGHPINRDPNTGDHLPFVPSHFNTYDTSGNIINTNLTRSIRIGDDCANGSSANPNGASKIIYQMNTTTQNAMLYLYYAFVSQAPGHGVEVDPSLQIRVMRQNAAGSWVLADSTLNILISATPAQGQGITVGGNNHYGNVVYQTSYDSVGWHRYGSGYNTVCYKDWERVTLNLGNYIGESVRVEVGVGDCGYNAHYSYAYICGECRPLEFNITALPNDAAYGSVSGGGTYFLGETATLSAMPRNLHAFTGWTDGDTNNPRLVTVQGADTYTANFAPAVLEPVHDTTYITLTDTVILTEYDTVDNYIFDTVTEYDTIWKTDTIVIHDTVYVQENGIDEIAASSILLYQRGGCIVVEDADGGMLPEVRLFDAAGRELGGKIKEESGKTVFTVPTSGVYLVKVGDRPARRVVVIK